VQKQKQHTVSELSDSKQSEYKLIEIIEVYWRNHIAWWYITHHIIINHPRRLIDKLLLEIDAGPGARA
jgi:hypothetical protein